MADQGSRRARLRDVVLEEQREHGRLLQLIEEPTVEPELLVDQIDLLERLDDKRDELVGELRREATRLARRRGERSARQLLLAALARIGMPQQAGFLQEYVWACDRVDLDRRQFASLRRDEQRSWLKDPDGRIAFVAPVLTETGEPLRGWMARSDWPLEQRIVLPDSTERLVDLRKIEALLHARGERRDPEVHSPFDALLERYMETVFELPGIVMSRPGSRKHWRKLLADRAGHEAEQLRGGDQAARVRAAKQLAKLPPEQQLWGTSADSAVSPDA
jgi:hypothetical protein